MNFLINSYLRKQEGYFKIGIQLQRSDQKFLDQFWAYLSKVEDLVEEYKYIIRDYQNATNATSHWDSALAQDTNAVDFYETSSHHITAANEQNNKAQTHTQTACAESSEPAKDAAMSNRERGATDAMVSTMKQTARP